MRHFSQKITAHFLGYQETLSKPVPLFNITGGPRDKSTVTLVTLEREGIPIPQYPLPLPRDVKLKVRGRSHNRVDRSTQGAT